ncbi:MAG: hypothetical protein K8R99_12120 [Actinomycetia bacterium]|nr:hypothetical protein [Actinomycetes bacterium]
MPKTELAMKVLFFSPFADVWPHSFPEALVAEMCEASGCEVTVIRCGGVLSHHCIAMSAAGLEPNAPRESREKICRSCRKHSALLDDEFRFASRNIEDYVDNNDREQIDLLVQSLSRDSWYSFELDNIPIGRLAAYEFFLGNKLNSYEIPEALWGSYIGQLRNSLAVFFAAKKFLVELGPDRIVVYNALYSVNNVLVHLAKQATIATLTIHGGLNIERLLETLCVSNDIQSQITASRSESWDEVKAIPIGARAVDEVLAYVRFLLRGTGAFVYSSAHGAKSLDELRREFGVSPAQKVVLCTTSSEDEMIAAGMVGAVPPATTDGALFESQLSWLKYVVAMGARHPEWFVIVRVHPREFPNRREGTLSQNATRLREALTDLPPNVAINWPDQGVSLYDLAQITDVLLNGISNAGIEFLLLGIPVVVHNPGALYAYPRAFNYSATSPNEYELVIAQAIQDGWSVEHVRNAFRWKTFQFRRLSVDLGASIPPWSARTPLRVLRGLRYQWKWPIPLRLILGVEKHRVRARPVMTPQREVIVDTIRHHRNNLGMSPLWDDDTYASQQEETAALLAAVSELKTIFAAGSGHAGGLAAQMSDYLASVDGVQFE